MKNKKVIGVLGLASVALVGGTFAYFTQTATIDNPFDTANYRTSVTEDFIPEDGENWQPGAEVNKDLYVQNTGDRDVVVRVKFEDYWYRGESLVTEGDGKNTFVELEGEGVTALPENGGTFQAGEEGTVDGKTENDGTVVFKTLENSGEWTFSSEDGYWYYNKPLAPGASTGKFLDKVQLDPQIDMGLFNTQIYSKVAKKTENPLDADFDKDQWTEEEKKSYEENIDKFMVDKGWTWIEEKPGKVVSVTPTSIDLFNKYARENYTKESMVENGLGMFTTAVVRAEADALGYSDANYVLRITVDTVQATDKAVLQEFFSAEDVDGINDTAIKTLYGNWNLSKEALEEE